MISEQTEMKLRRLGLDGMAEAYSRQRSGPDSAALGFDERLAMLVDCQWEHQENVALQRRLGYAKLRQSAALEDIDWNPRRALPRDLIAQLATGDWVRYHRHCIITGPTGSGKSWLACALAQKACRDGHRVLYLPAANCSATCSLPPPMAPCPGSSAACSGPGCWSSTTGGWTAPGGPSTATSSNCSTNAPIGARC